MREKACTLGRGYHVNICRGSPHILRALPPRRQRPYDMLMPRQEKANLARVRDNQRRSRARRKEYLQELEARLRQCELQGVEASSEIQAVARRVADENKKLRGLLAQQGVGDTSVEAYLQTSAPSVSEGPDGQHGSQDAAVRLLEQLLSTRQSCCTNGSESVAASCGRDGSGGSVATTPSHWNSSYAPTALAAPTASATRSKTQQMAEALFTQQFMAPGTTSTTGRTSTASVGNRSTLDEPHHQKSCNLSPASHTSSHHQQMLEYDQFSWSDQTYSQFPGRRQQLSYQHAQQQQSSTYAQTTTSSNVNSCNNAADIITTIAGTTDHAAIRAELGCVGGTDCEVDNQIVFNMLDRYSGPDL